MGVGHRLKIAAKHAVPPRALNRTMLAFPRLYSTKLVNYETNLPADKVDELLDQLNAVLSTRGDIVECGTSRCGSAVLMARQLKRTGTPKRILACDSFAGFDKDELDHEQSAGLTSIAGDAFTSTSLDYVRTKLQRLGLQDVITLVPGYFQDTLPSLEDTFCFAFIDCDLSEPVRFCAKALWPRLNSTGRMVFDDYDNVDFRGVADVVDAFVMENGDEIASHGLERGLYHVVKG